MASDEVLIKVAADLSSVDSGFKDLSVKWDKHNADIAKGEKAYKQYADTIAKENGKVDKAMQSNIDKVAAEGKAIQELEKKFDSLNKKNEKSFDTKKLTDFNNSLKLLSANIGNLDQFDISTEDLDFLTSKLSAAQDDFEALNILVDFFEGKMKSSATTVADSFDVLKKKIEETKLNISSTEDFIKDIDKQIDNTAPGKTQATLISERKAAEQALREETIALADYQSQLKKAREENVSMATQLRKVKDELVQLELAGERGSTRWEELTNKAEEYTEAISSTNQEISRQASATEGLDNVIGAVNGIVGAYSAAQGAQALFGDESEDLQKTLVRLNGAIALLNGLQAIQTELTKEETIAGRALTFVKAQYAVATDAGAKATTRLAAATKLLGIGLLVGALAAIVVYWKDIAKFVGLTSDETERLNAVQKKSNEIAGDQVAKLKVLIKQVEEGTLTFHQKREAVESYNKEFGDTLGAVDSYAKLEKKLIEQGADYIRYLQLKAQAEAAYELAVEKSKEALEKRNSSEISLSNVLVGIVSGPVEGATRQVRQNQEQADDSENQSEKYLDLNKELVKQAEELGKKLGINLSKVSQDTINEYEKLSDVLASLIDQQEAYRIEAIEDGREREKEILRARLQEEKENYQKQIDDLKVSEERKAEIRAQFNEIYNNETGAAYEQLRKDIAKVDEKYDAELESAKFKALSAIDAVIGNEDDLSRQAIEDKWDGIRDLIQNQIDKTNDEFEKEGLNNILLEIDVANKKELNDFNLDAGLRRVDREKEIAEKILAIQQANLKDIVKNEDVKALQLLSLQKNYLNEILETYKRSFKNLEEQELFTSITDTLKNSLDSNEIEEAANKLRQAFGDEVANEILNTVDSLKQVGKEINTIGSQTGLGNVVSEIAQWTSSLEGFGLKLGESLGLQGEAAQEFAEFTANSINSVVDGLTALVDAEIEQRRAKIDAIEESINAVEQEVEREKQLYEDGYANNYEARQEDLNNLKQQKKQEEEELKKAQKQKALIQNAENIANLAAQASNLITSVTEITKAHSGIPFVGVALAIGFIATMFGAIAQAKAQAQQITQSQGQSFRRGLKEGALSLSGPRHEEKGFGLYNSKTGERVAEFEDGEKLYTLNRNQHKSYGDILDAMILDAKGTGDLKAFLMNKYDIPTVGRESLKVVKHVNEITVKTQKSKEEASQNETKLLEEISKFRNEFKEEFKGHRKKEDSKVEAWETKEFYYVKIGNVTKKYPK